MTRTITLTLWIASAALIVASAIRLFKTETVDPEPAAPALTAAAEAGPTGAKVETAEPPKLPLPIALTPPLPQGLSVTALPRPAPARRAPTSEDLRIRELDLEAAAQQRAETEDSAHDLKLQVEHDEALLRRQFEEAQ